MDLSTSTNILAILQSHGYIILFLLMFLEGPVVTIIAAFLASLGIFNIYFVLILSVLGNISADMSYFFIGRLGKKTSIRRYVNESINKEKIKRIKDYLRDNPFKTLTVIKLTPPLPIPGLILSGAADMPLKSFFAYTSIISIAYSSFAAILGFCSGMVFGSISKYMRYIEFLVGAVVILIIVVWLLLRFLSKKISNKIEKI